MGRGAENKHSKIQTDLQRLKRLDQRTVSIGNQSIYTEEFLNSVNTLCTKALADSEYVSRVGVDRKGVEFVGKNRHTHI